MTNLVSDVLNKAPELTFVVIKEFDLDNWGLNGEQVSVLREKGITAERKK